MISIHRENAPTNIDGFRGRRHGQECIAGCPGRESILAATDGQGSVNHAPVPRRYAISSKAGYRWTEVDGLQPLL
jgi:hypothetical protein